MTRSKSLHWYWGDVPCQSVRSNLEQRARRRGTEGIRSLKFTHFIIFSFFLFAFLTQHVPASPLFSPLLRCLHASAGHFRVISSSCKKSREAFWCKNNAKHIWWWTRSCDIVWTLAMAQVHPLILSGLVYNVTLFAIWSCLQHPLRLQNSTKWLTQVQIMFDFDHVSCFMFLGINKICKIPRSKFLVNIATFCFEKCPLYIKTEFYSIC